MAVVPWFSCGPYAHPQLKMTCCEVLNMHLMLTLSTNQSMIDRSIQSISLCSAFYDHTKRTRYEVSTELKEPRPWASREDSKSQITDFKARCIGSKGFWDRQKWYFFFPQKVQISSKILPKIWKFANFRNSKMMSFLQRIILLLLLLINCFQEILRRLFGAFGLYFCQENDAWWTKKNVKRRTWRTPTSTTDCHLPVNQLFINVYTWKCERFDVLTVD